jgi:alkylated DNA nucleotide flippase Atl1
MAKSWADKMNKPELPKIVNLPPDGAKKMGGKTMVVAPPSAVAKLMAKVPEGKIATVAELRGALARQFKTETACPLTTGIFIWLAANAAAESGDAKFPFWRTTKAKGELVAKYPGGMMRQKKMLEAEGAKVEARGAKFFVKDFQGRVMARL